MLAALALVPGYSLPHMARPSSCARSVTMGSTEDFKVGLTIEFDDAVWRVQEFLHGGSCRSRASCGARWTQKTMPTLTALSEARARSALAVKPGKGSAFVRSKLKNLQTGSTLEKTWKAGEKFPDAQVDKEEMQFSYIDGEEHVFMNVSGGHAPPLPCSARPSPASRPHRTLRRDPSADGDVRRGAHQDGRHRQVRLHQGRDVRSLGRALAAPRHRRPPQEAS